MSFDVVEFHRLIDPFMERFTHGTNHRFQVQRAPISPDKTIEREQLSYGYRENRPLNYQDWMRHFSQSLFKCRWRDKDSGALIEGVQATLAIVGKFEGKICKWVCVDCDNAYELEEIREKLLPIYDKYNIPWIMEWSGANKDRGHIWFLCEATEIEVMSRFIDQLFEEAGLDRHTFEIYPLFDKEDSVIRPPGGYHIRWGQAGPCTWNGKTSNEPLFILETFNSIPRVTQQEIISRLKKVGNNKSEAPLRTQASNSFYYTSRNLPRPVAGLPRFIDVLSRECQAINEIIRRSDQEGLLDERLKHTHLSGLWLYNMAIYQDLKLEDSNGEGKKWAEEFFETRRWRSYDSHNWGKVSQKFEDSPGRLVPGCEKWSAAFGLCQGCPFAGRTNFTNPRQFFYGKRIRKNILKEMKLVSPDEIRATTFISFKNRIHSLINSNSRQDVLLASPQGSGKSFCLDAVVVELARQGKRILIAVPSGQVAMEHKERIEKAGIKAFVLMSHKNTFKEENGKRRFGLDFNCPFFNEIQDAVSLGMSSASYKDRYCERCPKRNQCPYPDQYERVKSPEHQVVIIQHAHFRCRETLSQIMKDENGKEFDALFVDESFIGSLLHRIKPSIGEWELLSEFKEMPWIPKFVHWLHTGGMPDGIINASEASLNTIRKVFMDNGLEWRIPELIRYFNNKTYHARHIGISNFTPLPDVRIRVFTDATPPLDIMKKVLNNDQIEVFGEDEVIDYRLLNPENKVIQVLDSSMSKTKLNENDRLYDILEFIWDKANKEYKGLKILITSYLDEYGSKKENPQQWMTNIKQWFWQQDKFNEVQHLFTFAPMSIGTNQYEDINIQFLVSGIYGSGWHFASEVYNIKTIENYWNRLSNKEYIGNIYPGEPTSENHKRGIDRIPSLVSKIVPIGNKAAIFEFPQFEYWEPEYYHAKLIEEYNIARTQQAIRLRFKDTEKKVVYVFGNYFFPSMLITDVVVEDELLGYIRKNTTIE